MGRDTCPGLLPPGDTFTRMWCRRRAALAEYVSTASIANLFARRKRVEFLGSRSKVSVRQTSGPRSRMRSGKEASSGEA